MAATSKKLNVKEFLRRPRHVDLLVKEFTLPRYKMLTVGAVCWVVSSLVYVGLLFLFDRYWK